MEDMTMSKVYDYTTMRKGTKTDYGRKIDVCPKCGRKGEKVERENPRNGAKWAEYTHKGHVSVVASVVAGVFACFHVDDYCSVLIAAPRKPETESGR
jgi:hypothetical protein